MTKWLLSNEAMLKRRMQKSFWVRLVVRAMLAVAIAGAEHDEKKARQV